MIHRFEVTFERSAVQIYRVLVDAADEAEAEQLAQAYVDKGKNDGAIINLENEIYPDEESVWALLDTEQTSPKTKVEN